MGECHPQVSRTRWFGERDAIILRVYPKFEIILSWIAASSHLEKDSDCQFGQLRTLVDVGEAKTAAAKAEVEVRLFDIRFEMLCLGALTEIYIAVFATTSKETIVPHFLPFLKL